VVRLNRQKFIDQDEAKKKKLYLSSIKCTSRDYIESITIGVEDEMFFKSFVVTYIRLGFYLGL
jgi:hypothetical protein